MHVNKNTRETPCNGGAVLTYARCLSCAQVCTAIPSTVEDDRVTPQPSNGKLFPGRLEAPLILSSATYVLSTGYCAGPTRARDKQQLDQPASTRNRNLHSTVWTLLYA